MVSDISPDPCDWVNRPKFYFSDMVMLHIKLNGITKYIIMLADILPQILPLRLWGSKDQNATFLEHGHVAYQIKGNQKCSNIVANILPAEPPLPTASRILGVERLNSTISDYSHVTYQIKGNHKCSNTVTNILPIDPP